MKKLIYYIVITGLLLTSCSENFLNVMPESIVTDGNFYKTEGQFNQALAGAYAATRSIYSDYSSFTMGEMRSDNTHYEYNPTARGTYFLDMEFVDGFLDGVTNYVSPEKYNYCYIAIARVNAILDNLPNVDLGQEVTDQIIGESKFLRALCYFELVRYFGGVPLYLNMVTSEETAYLPRSSAEDVYNTIVDDLKDAVAKLSAPSFPQNGRATKGSAKMMLADVYLTNKSYGLAETELKDIMTMGYELMLKYSDVYEVTNKNSKESIFEIQYQQGNQGQQSDFIYPFLPVSGDLSIVTGITSKSDAYGGWNMPTKDLMDSYEAGDERMGASIGVIEGSGPVGNMVIEAVKSIVGYTKPDGKRVFFFVKKYLHPHSLEMNTDDNFPVYRFSEALLSLAEVLNEQNKSSEALPYLNQVRTRAKLTPITTTNQALLRDIIAHERCIELAFENKRWLDLVRTGKAIEVMIAHGQEMKASAEYYYLPDNSYNITTNNLIFAIPIREIQIGNLEQNPGY